MAYPINLSYNSTSSITTYTSANNMMHTDHHHSHRRATESPSDKDDDEPLSHVRFIELQDRVAPLPGDYSSISILNPSIYIEREKRKPNEEGKKMLHDLKAKPELYCINTSFTLE